jgi:hypothetical protein
LEIMMESKGQAIPESMAPLYKSDRQVEFIKGRVCVTSHWGQDRDAHQTLDGRPARRILHPDSEESKRLMRELLANHRKFTMEASRDATFNRFNERTGEFVMPAVAPYKVGELVRVVRKDKAGKVRRFADWVVEVQAGWLSKDSAAVSPTSAAFYMDQLARTGASIQDTLKNQRGWLVRLPEPVSLPTRVSYGLEPSPEWLKLDLRDRAMKPNSIVFMPDEWLRRLTAPEARQIKGMQVGEPL